MNTGTMSVPFESPLFNSAPQLPTLSWGQFILAIFILVVSVATCGGCTFLCGRWWWRTMTGSTPAMRRRESQRKKLRRTLAGCGAAAAGEVRRRHSVHDDAVESEEGDIMFTVGNGVRTAAATCACGRLIVINVDQDLVDQGSAAEADRKKRT